MSVHRVRRSAWQEQVVAKANFLEYERDRRLSSTRDQDHPIRTTTDARLKEARHAAGLNANGDARRPNSRMARLANVWTGALIEGAFVNLHTVEVLLVDLYKEEDIRARSPGVLARMRTCLAPTDRRLLDAEALFGDVNGRSNGSTTSHSGRGPVLQTMRERLSGSNGNHAANELSQRRAALREAMKISYEAADEQHASARSLRNVLIAAALLLSALVALVCLVGFRDPAAIPLCFEPSGEDPACPSTDAANPQPLDVPIVALMGVLGGAMSATFAIQRLRGTSTPYAIPVALSFLKLPAGALTAIGGLVLIHGQFVPGLTALDTQGQILAYAIVLGVAQQLVTRFVDQKAEDVLANVPSKGRPPTSTKPSRTKPVESGQVTPAPTKAA